jgi:AraC-like DNA-binding protein
MPSLQTTENLAYFRHAALPGIELLVANPSTGSWQMFHERYLISAFRAVASSWVYRRKTYFAEDGATTFMEPGEVHRVVEKRKPSHFYALFVEREQFLKLAEECGLAGVPHFATIQVQSAELLRRIKRLSVLLQRGDNSFHMQSELAILVHEVLRYAETPPPELKVSRSGLKRSLENARKMLEERMYEQVSLDELSAASALSRFHLVRNFAVEFGLPPHAYQIHLRIKHACRLLRKGLSCVEVASSVGFADQSHFARHFRKMMGVTPSVYSRSLS